MGSYSAIGVGGLQTHIERLAEPLYQRPNNRTVSSIFEKKIQIKKVLRCGTWLERSERALHGQKNSNIDYRIHGNVNIFI
jgi:hypothetical protein